MNNCLVTHAVMTLLMQLFHCYDNALQPSNRLNDSSDVERRKGAAKRLSALPREFPPLCGKPAVIVTAVLNINDVWRLKQR